MPARRRLLWIAIAALGVIVVLAVASAFLLQPSRLRAQAERTLADRLGLDVTIADLSLRLLPRPRVSGTGLTLRVPGRPELAPFISIDRFSADVGLLSAFRHHVDTVHIDGLRIAVPPADARRTLPKPTSATGTGDAIVDHLVTHNASLAFLPKKDGDRPLTFAIHDLSIHNLSLDHAWPFEATLTNPVPRGLVTTTGTFGPWLREDPSQSPISGDYTLTDADLGTINGIGGILQSTGRYEGRLTEIRATGSTTTPDFSLDLGGKPLPLSTTFVAVVDGTNGTTVLEEVKAQLLDTKITATGAITNLEGPGRHDVRIDSEVTDGRIEDMLALAIDSPEPLLVGDLTAKSSLSLPPGQTPVRRRLQISGTFGLASARFTDAEVQDKVRELSRRSRGKREEEVIGRVMTNLRGRYRIHNGVVTLTGLAFQVPGATVAMAGTYRTDDGALDFRGTLRMEATVSKAVGGFKSIFLKPFDALFRKEGAGAVVPIRLTGTRDEPKFGVEMGRILK